jgi:hypothetical protein
MSAVLLLPWYADHVEMLTMDDDAQRQFDWLTNGFGISEFASMTKLATLSIIVSVHDPWTTESGYCPPRDGIPQIVIGT